jgi:unsaturated rhamnogalacturonyl hydrolase
MDRRRFVKRTLFAGAAAGAAILVPVAKVQPQGSSKRTVDALVEKVERAMLTMQRDAWEQGVAAQALLESGKTDLVVLLAKEAVVRQVEDGRLAVISCWEGVTDPAANGEAVLFAAKQTGDPKLKLAADKMLAYLLKKAPRRKDGTLYHIANKPQVWIDSLYMAPPFLAVAGQPQEAVKQVEGIRRVLWNQEKKLFSHIWDDSKNDFFRKDFWGVGNGWAAAGMTRIIKALPANMEEEKKRLVKYVNDVVDGCLAYQRQDALFHDVVDNPKTFIETNLAQMLAYTIYRGVSGGWLQASYLKQADKMREAARQKVDEYGYVQGVCGSPNFESAGTATEGQSFFLLMEAAAGQVAPATR